MGTAAVLLCVAYLLGSVPFGWIVGKALGGIDVRQHGSRSVGATNVGRTLGRKAGLVVFLLDAAKGAVPALLVRILAGEAWWAGLVAVAAVLGHSYPVFIGFRGGKGVATAFGAFLVLMPIPSLLALALWGAVVGATRYVSLGSMIGTTSASLWGLAFGYPRPVVAFAILTALVVIFRHRENVRRLEEGRESRVGRRRERAAEASDGGQRGS